MQFCDSDVFQCGDQNQLGTYFIDFDPQIHQLTYGIFQKTSEL